MAKRNKKNKKAKRWKFSEMRLRTLILAGVIVVLFVVLIIRLAVVMIVKGPEYSSMAARQQTRTSSIHAQRGRIMDRNGTVLAQSGSTYQVLINPQVITGSADEQESERVRVSIYLSDVLDMSYDAVYAKVARTDKSQVVLKRQVSSETVDKIRALNLGRVVTYSTDYTRYYTNGRLFAQLIGFTSTDGEGQTGLEAYLNESLAGRDGRVVYQKDARGNALAYGDEQYVSPTDGYDVTLTVDANMEEYLESALASYRASTNAINVTGLVMDPSTGAILATASAPTFDLNNPDRGDVKSLMAMSRNRCVTDRYECGTMFKLITLAAALDTGAVTLDTTFSCTGSMTFRTETFYCRTYTKAHKSQTLYEALASDCDCVFMQLALKVGTNTLYDYITNFGFGTGTKSGMPNETSGDVPHRKYSRQDNLALIATGKGLTATPMQMLQAISCCINGGILYKPYVTDLIADSDGNAVEDFAPTMLRRVISSKTSEDLRRVLKYVVDSGNGSASQMVQFSSGGMPGVSYTYDDDGNASQTVYVSSFFGFAPANEPKYVCLFVANEPEVPAAYTRYCTAYYVGSTLNNLLRYSGQLPDTTRESIVMPDVCNQTASDAAYVLVRSGMPTPVYLENESEAYVVRQVPAAGTTVSKGTKAVLYTSMTTFNNYGVHSNQVRVPDLSDRRRQFAYDELERLGLKIGYDKTACLGKIIAQSIEPGTYVDPGTEVYVTFSEVVPAWRSFMVDHTQDGENAEDGAVPADTE